MPDTQRKILQNGIIAQNKVNTRKIGNIAEDEVVKYIERKHFELLCRNFVTPYGEADIIAKDGDIFAFIEVKARSSNKYGLPAAAVTKKKMLRYMQIAQYYFMQNNIEDYIVRFDVAEVFGAKGIYDINYIQNAFDFTGISDFY